MHPASVRTNTDRGLTPETTYRPPRAALFVWGAGIEGETTTGGDVDINFDTLIRNLNMAFMGTFEARKCRWSIFADVVYLNVGALNLINRLSFPYLGVDANLSRLGHGVGEVRPSDVFSLYRASRHESACFLETRS
jgi:hypothetical protein